MPLSEQEQRLLDEMERQLMGGDADVVQTGEARPLSYRNIVYGSLLVLAGLAGIIAGVASSLIVIGVIAFVVMVAGVVLAITPAKNATPTSRSGAAPRASGANATFMDRMNDRWDRRQGER